MYVSMYVSLYIMICHFNVSLYICYECTQFRQRNYPELNHKYLRQYGKDKIEIKKRKFICLEINLDFIIIYVTTGKNMKDIEEQDEFIATVESETPGQSKFINSMSFES